MRLSLCVLSSRSISTEELYQVCALFVEGGCIVQSRQRKPAEPSEATPNRKPERIT